MYGLSPDYSDQESETGVHLRPFFDLLCLDWQEYVDCFAFDILPKVLERTSMLKMHIFPKSLTKWGGIFKSINCEFFPCI